MSKKPSTRTFRPELEKCQFCENKAVGVVIPAHLTPNHYLNKSLNVYFCTDKNHEKEAYEWIEALLDLSRGK